jgi:hypothetical protein
MKDVDARSLVKYPMASTEGDSGITPWVEILPNVGLNPTVPQKEAGRMMDPMV